MSRLSLVEVGLEIDNRWLVHDVSLDLQPNRLIAFVGPNGAGKTTLLRILAGLITPSKGRALLDDIDLDTFRRRDLARHIAFMPQDTHIDFAFTVSELVAMGRHAHLGRFERLTTGDHRAITEAMKRADVIALSNRFVTELSAGERQRVLIARSLATEADIILLDEPVANLDISHALDVLELCRT
ncbi:MAG: ABC transporter ATP-binding protein, partial [Pyrinomonadaceae bacterium]